ncbi:hypothetical protein INT45_004359 [Circinella minor]|uniref:Uncharacterized protein n=1 Tax=Circinella minor TaxID=1195481 RepID=A0A8H7VRM8_9FUNG|nr:hypothetical protein INT45_004359 [Circinella minor]
MSLLILSIILLASIGIHQVVGQIDEGMLPFGLNPPRQNPKYCVGFRITYPTEYGKAYQYGEMAHISWEVDEDLTIPPDLITRIRIMNEHQRNNQIIGENITIHTYKNKGAATFPILTHDQLGLQHYRVMVNYPTKDVHCVYESVPFVIAPRTFERFTELDTPPPKFAKDIAEPIKNHREYRDYYM